MSQNLTYRGGGGSVGGGGEVEEVEEGWTSQGGAKPAARERPNALRQGRPGGDPAAPTQRPAPNARHPTPGTQRPATASPTAALGLRRLHRWKGLGLQPRARYSKALKVTSSPT